MRDQERDELAALRAELEEARETNRRLNRRVQDLEHRIATHKDVMALFADGRWGDMSKAFMRVYAELEDIKGRPQQLAWFNDFFKPDRRAAKS